MPATKSKTGTTHKEFNDTNTVSYDLYEINGDKNHVKAITKRMGKTHELIVFTISEDEFEKLNRIDSNHSESVISFD
jgi:uncharacterized linocin/CFP29 family protein